ncbi:MAG: 2-C-methyl-D-erythritol 2,4-cyclodiphosphate synthase [Ignavibacteriales bacterium]|nr:MAG: 2-C-methyl-D-erythritol 2,4-cyclodiphosphate synthase [Ignavibacteriales bacterium]
MNTPFRIGFGYDVHQFANDRKLYLGGIEIEHHSGLKGHSDADALLHSITDALLGALALGDIGTHFPDTDSQYKGIASRILLEKTYDLVMQEGFKIANIDATVVAENPKLNPHIKEIRRSIASILKLEVDQVSVKATTSEKMGFVGEEKGVKVYAVVLIYKDEN